MKYFVTLFTVLLLAQGVSAQNRTSMQADLALATVQWSKSTEVYTLMSSDFRKLTEAAQTQVQRALTLEEKKKFLDNTLNEILISQAALEGANKITPEMIVAQVKSQSKDKTDAAVNGQIELLLRQSGAKNLSDLSKSITVQNYLRAHPLYPKEEPKIDVDGAAISKFYDENKSKFIRPESIRISHLYFDGSKIPNTRQGAKKKADDALTQIKSGKITFEAAVLDLSEDLSTNTSHGDLGFTTLERAENTFMGKDTVRQLFNLGVGNVSAVFESKLGYHIFKVTDKRELKVLGLDDRHDLLNPKTVRIQIREIMEAQQKGVVLEGILEKIAQQLKKQNPSAVQIRITDSDLKNY